MCIGESQEEVLLKKQKKYLANKDEFEWTQLRICTAKPRIRFSRYMTLDSQNAQMMGQYEELVESQVENKMRVRSRLPKFCFLLLQLVKFSSFV